MAIAFHPPEISSADATPTAAVPSGSSTYYNVPVHQQSGTQYGVTVPSLVILTPSSVVMQHQVVATHQLWVSSPQHTSAQQQMSNGFPPIFHNNTAHPTVGRVEAPPQNYHRVAYTRRTPLGQQECRRCVTSSPGRTTPGVEGSCTACNDIRRGMYLIYSDHYLTDWRCNKLNTRDIVMCTNP